MSPYSAQATWAVDYGNGDSVTYINGIPVRAHDAGFSARCEADRIAEEIRERDAKRCAELKRIRGRW